MVEESSIVEWEGVLRRERRAQCEVEWNTIAERHDSIMRERGFVYARPKSTYAKFAFSDSKFELLPGKGWRGALLSTSSVRRCDQTCEV